MFAKLMKCRLRNNRSRVHLQYLNKQIISIWNITTYFLPTPPYAPGDFICAWSNVASPGRVQCYRQQHNSWHTNITSCSTYSRFQVQLIKGNNSFDFTKTENTFWDWIVFISGSKFLKNVFLKAQQEHFWEGGVIVLQMQNVKLLFSSKESSVYNTLYQM